jgi:hypothetical protein
MTVSESMYEAFAAANGIELTEEAKPGIEGTLTMIAEGKGEVPEWMPHHPVFELVLAARELALNPESVPGSVAAEEAATSSEVSA